MNKTTPCGNARAGPSLLPPLQETKMRSGLCQRNSDTANHHERGSERRSPSNQKPGDTSRANDAPEAEVRRG